MKLIEAIGGKKKLRIFDFDDSLVKTGSKVHVYKDGKKITITPGKWVDFKPEEGDTIDFSDFDRVILPKPIEWTMKLLKKFRSKQGDRQTVILTARHIWKPLKDYLQSQIGYKVFVVNLASADPKRKAGWIEMMIKKGYNDIEFFEDTPKNIQAVDKLKKKYPKVKIRTHHVKS